MSCSIVFIDDDEDDLLMLEESVTSTFPGIECLRFSSPVSAVTYLSSPEVNPLCIFIDINMPVMQGDEVLREIKIRDHLNKSSITILSTCITEHAREVLLGHGADYAIIKPPSFCEFRDRVCGVIQHQLTKSREREL
jgi:DNA-binding response OmpR family regulator